MNKRTLLLMTSLLFITPVYALQIIAPQNSPVNSTIRIQITDNSGNPLPNSTVTFSGIEALPIVLFTDVNGSCKYLPSKTGILNITAEKDGEPASMLVEIYTPFQGININIPSKVSTGSKIIIKIVDNSGNPVENAIVTLTGIDPLPIVQFSDQKGEVNYRAMKAGTLTITAEKEGHSTTAKVAVTEKSEKSASSPGAGGGGGGGSTSSIYEIILYQAEEEKFSKIELEPEKASEIIDMEIKPKMKLYNAKFEIEPLSKLPGTIPKPEKPAYKYMKITLSTSAVEETKIRFRVNISWLKEKNINPDTVKMLRYKKTSWEELETKLVENKDSDFFIYEAQSRGFSYFAVVGEENSGFKMDYRKENEEKSDFQRELFNIPSKVKDKSLKKELNVSKTRIKEETKDTIVEYEENRVKNPKDKSLCGPSVITLIAFLITTGIKKKVKGFD